MDGQPETIIFFGYNGILFADAIKQKLKEKKERETRIEEKIRRLEVALSDPELPARPEALLPGVSNGSTNHHEKEESL